MLLLLLTSRRGPVHPHSDVNQLALVTNQKCLLFIVLQNLIILQLQPLVCGPTIKPGWTFPGADSFALVGLQEVTRDFREFLSLYTSRFHRAWLHHIPAAPWPQELIAVLLDKACNPTRCAAARFRNVPETSLHSGPRRIRAQSILDRSRIKLQRADRVRQGVRHKNIIENPDNFKKVALTMQPTHPW